MKYIVSIGYRKFEFDDSLTAVAFAERAKIHYVHEKDESSLSVEIELVIDEPAEAEEKED